MLWSSIREFFLQEDGGQDVQGQSGSEEGTRESNEINNGKNIEDNVIDVEECIKHGWRYLNLKPYEVYKLTHKEFSIISKENIEVTHDRREELALAALMNSVAYRGKGEKGKLPSITELYDRNSERKANSMEDIMKQQQEAMTWLSKHKIVNKEKSN